MIIGVAFCGCQAAKVTIYSEDEIGVKRRRRGYFQLEKTVFFLTGLKMVVGVGFCKIKVDSNFLLLLKIKCTKFHQGRSKTVDLHTKYTNKETFSFIYIQCGNHLWNKFSNFKNIDICQKRGNRSIFISRVSYFKLLHLFMTPSIFDL
jgi:hypothetical protein